ncbi:MAG: sigma-70 family RNA polymerase sigma factor, partial [Planctomycetia bacterium]
LSEVLKEKVTAEDRKNPLALAKFISGTMSRRRWTRDKKTRTLIKDYTHLKHRLASANIRLAAHLAKRFRSYGVPYSDLLHEAVCGLMHAIDRFDLNFDTRLATYATWWIRQALQIAVAQQSHLVSLSPHHLQQLGRWQQEVEAMAHADSEIPSNEKVQSRKGVESAQLTRLQAVARSPVSIDATLDESSEFSLSHVVTQQDAFAERNQFELKELLGHLMHHLQPRERTVLTLRYGLTGEGGLSLRDIGKVLLVSKERVRQIQNRALDKLRAAATQDGLKGSLLSVP